MLRFKVDENLPNEVAAPLIDAGHDAQSVPGEQLSGHADLDVANACRTEGRTLITLDLDFADIRTYAPADYPGIVVLRLSRLDRDRVMAVILRLLPALNQEQLTKSLWIVDESTVRIRK